MENVTLASPPPDFLLNPSEKIMGNPCNSTIQWEGLWHGYLAMDMSVWRPRAAGTAPVQAPCPGSGGPRATSLRFLWKPFATSNDPNLSNRAHPEWQIRS